MDTLNFKEEFRATPHSCITKAFKKPIIDICISYPNINTIVLPNSGTPGMPGVARAYSPDVGACYLVQVA